MEFNLQKFLVEHKLTTRSRLNEDDNTGGMMKTDAEQGEIDDEEMFGDEPEDTYYKDEFDDTGEFEKEPAATSLKGGGKEQTLQSKQLRLQTLQAIKDELVQQYNKHKDIAKYKQDSTNYKIPGEDTTINIPAEIKKLKADIDRMSRGGEDEEEGI